MTTTDGLEWIQEDPLFHTSLYAVAEGIDGNGVLSTGDMEITATNNSNEIEVATGTLWYSGDQTEYSIGTAETHTLSDNNSGDDRWDLVVFDTSLGTPASDVVEGTAAADPEPPLPSSGQVVLGYVYLADGETNVTNSEIKNWRTPSTDAGDVRLDDANNNYNATNVEDALNEVEGQYVNEGGDTMTGTLTAQGSPALDAQGDIEDSGTTIWDSTGGHVEQSALENDSLTVTAGDGLKNGGSVALGGTTTLDIEPADFAGTHLSDDGSDNLTVDDDFVENTGDTMTGTLTANGSPAIDATGGGDVSLAKPSSIGDGSNDRVVFGNNRTTIASEGGDVADSPRINLRNGSAVRLYVQSDASFTIEDEESDGQGLQYDTDASSGVLRTPNAGARIEDDGIVASGEGLQLRYDPATPVAKINSYDDDNTAYRDLKFGASLYDFTGNAADLRLATGQSLEDGGGVNRIQLFGNGTELKGEGGTTQLRLSEPGAGGVAQIRAYSNGEFEVSDQEGSFTALKYSTSGSAPGMLKLDANTYIKDGAGLVVGDDSRQSFTIDESRLQVKGTRRVDSSIGVVNYASGANEPAVIYTARSKSGTVGSTGTAVADGDQLLRFDILGDDGGGIGAGSRAASIRSQVDGSVSADAVPGRLEFYTGGLNEALRIDSNQQIRAETDGSASAPVWTFGSDTDTGIYRATTDVLSLVAGGNEQLKALNNGINIVSGRLDLGGNRIQLVGGTTAAGTGAIRMGDASGVSGGLMWADQGGGTDPGIYVKSDGEVYVRDDDGNESKLT